MERIDNNDHQDMPNQEVQPLPNATLILTLGVISLITLFCYQPASLLLAIIALILAYIEDNNYKASPMSYTRHSYTNLKTGRVCAIIAAALSGILLFFALLGISHFLNELPFFENLHFESNF
ncbi:hypothetical protein EMN47_14455 [Prolixibacteraceae bacterium JC049]|nr:hypothetical protein [Prolixibacteraceae bacterium JC049]